MMSKGHSNAFSTLLAFKKRFGLIRGSEFWSKQMALRTNKLWWSRGSDVSRCQKAIRNHFVHFEHRKKRLGWSSLSYVLRTRMASRTHNLPSKRLKIRLWWYGWSNVSWCRKDIRKHFLHSGHSKKRFLNEVAEVMFHVGEWTWELIICLLVVF
jgi:hypothetical protein